MGICICSDQFITAGDLQKYNFMAGKLAMWCPVNNANQLNASR